ncbi:metallophosphoesterase [Enterococcus termitis]
MNIAFTTDSHYTWGTGKVNAWYGLSNLNNILSLSDKVDVVVAGGDNVDGGNYSKLGNLSNCIDYMEYFLIHTLELIALLFEEIMILVESIHTILRGK